MFNTLILSDCNFSKNLIASAYLVDLGYEYFTVECASFEPGPLNPLVSIMMRQDGYDLSHCDIPFLVSDLLNFGRSYDIVITIGSKRCNKKCPDFPGQLMQLNWRHPDPDKVAESRIDRLQQIKTMRDSIKADVINLINKHEEGKLSVLR